MGYYINTREINFHIKQENFEPALAALKEAVKEKELEGSHWSWINNEDVLNCKTLPEFFSYQVSMWPGNVAPEQDEELWPKHCIGTKVKAGDLYSLEGYSDKAGSEEEWLSVLAPFVESGSYIEVSGENSEIWRWTFNNRQFENQTAHLCWKDYEGMLRLILEKDPKAAVKYMGIRNDLDKFLATFIKERKK